MGYLSHKVDPSDIKAGDHIYTWRNGFLYSHHGIYVGEQKVVHFIGDKASFGSGSGWNLFSSLNFNCECRSLNKRTLEEGIHVVKTSLCSSCRPCLGIPECDFQDTGTGVLISCLNCFIGTGSLYRYQYGVWKLTYVSKLHGGTCTMAKSDPPEEVIHKANYLPQHGFGRYDVILNNCEDFALYCKTGLMIRGTPTTGSSGQVNDVLSAVPWRMMLNTASLARSASGLRAARIASIAGIVSSLSVVSGGVAVVNYGWNRYAYDINSRDDVEKVSVEEAVEFRNRGI